MSAGKIKVLCVDDEPNVLDGLRRNLRKHFDVRTEESGAAGLQAIEETEGGFAVIVSDLRMPQMNGIEFLTKVREAAPDTTRVLLTGDADLTSAMAAVNEGNIFRFLTKPCEASKLIPAISAAAEHHRLVTAERELLEKTLHGSVNMLTEVLSIASPSAFGHATRLKKRAGDVARSLGESEAWKIELACMLSQVAHISLPNDVLEILELGEEFNEAQQEMVDRLPDVAVRLIADIPRLDDVQEILRQQSSRFEMSTTEAGNEIPIGARILKAVIDLGIAEKQEGSADAAIDLLRSRGGWYDPKVLDALSELYGGAASDGGEIVERTVRQLVAGMIILDAVEDANGRLLIAGGQEVSVGLCERLRNFAANAGVKEPLRVLVRP